MGMTASSTSPIPATMLNGRHCASPLRQSSSRTRPGTYCCPPSHGKVDEEVNNDSYVASDALQPHPRNVPDDVLDLLRANDGVIMTCLLPALTGVVSHEPGDGDDAGTASFATVQTVAAHIIYAGERIGYRRVGVGSDFDGMLDGPRALTDVSTFPVLVAELLARGVAETDVRQVLGLSILRVLERVQEQARPPHASSERLWDEVGNVWTDAQRDTLVQKGLERKTAAEEVDRELSVQCS